jgi:hypothetical protein
MNTIAVRRSHVRIAYGGLAAALLAAAVFEAVSHGTGYWQLAAFALGPDLALVCGAGRGLERGQLHPRAVRLYNLLHRFWLPAGLGVAAAFGLVPLGYLVGALAWGFHIALDRAVGYGFRNRDGFQRA